MPVNKSSLTTIDIFQLKILLKCLRINVNWYNYITSKIYSIDILTEESKPESTAGNMIDHISNYWTIIYHPKALVNLPYSLPTTNDN